MKRDGTYSRACRLGPSESNRNANTVPQTKRKARFGESASLRFMLGGHRFEIRRWLAEGGNGIGDGCLKSYVGLYDGYISVSATEPHVAVQMLLRRHFRKKRSGTVV